MNNNENDEMLEQLKLNIAAYKFKEEQKLNTLENKEKGGTFYMKKKIIMAACACLVLVSGIVAAKTIKFSNDTTSVRGLGKGVDTAIENGYIQNVEMDFQKFDDKGTEIKIENFFMDDLNLSVNFLFKFNENIEKMPDMELTGLIIRDEENRIIYSGLNQEIFEKYCKENNLDYEYLKFNENYMNCGWMVSDEKIEDNLIRLKYNINTPNTFPKSKKLYFSLEEITVRNVENGEVRGRYKGSWSTVVDVPERMYNRTNEYYKVVSCNNSLEVNSAFVTDIGFEIEINNMPAKGKKVPIGDTRSYVENENGEKFGVSFSVSKRDLGYQIIDNKLNFYQTFTMTKYDATDKIRVVLYYYDEPVIIELEKVK